MPGTVCLLSSVGCKGAGGGARSCVQCGGRWSVGAAALYGAEGVGMPALVVFGRRWSIASDDVPVLAVVPTVFHAAWSVALLVLWNLLDR